jgi:hypothetical protein
MRFYGVLAGVERAVADFPNWETAQIAKIEKLEAEAVFAAKNGINSAQ